MHFWVSSEDLETTGETLPFYLETTFLELKGGPTVGKILTKVLAEVVSGCHANKKPPVGGTGGSSGVGCGGVIRVLNRCVHRGGSGFGSGSGGGSGGQGQGKRWKRRLRW